jgi:hypothetical protein
MQPSHACESLGSHPPAQWASPASHPQKHERYALQSPTMQSGAQRLSVHDQHSAPYSGPVQSGPSNGKPASAPSVLPLPWHPTTAPASMVASNVLAVTLCTRGS